ncbi:MAG: PLP-dependent aspartate aminotransferase family protein [Gammaproteobacteria bacterium]|nr:PLP-dependent aspartate aminotransferase family protein [Gammaproteobacteria bacterium]MDH3537251.1 PLP-dependent aspartate aminotransferase family protein [Gammaproteobacteria bacterium]
MTGKKDLSLETRLAQACHYIDEVTGGTSPPLQLSTTYSRDADYEYISPYSYGRSDNPSWEVLEKVCASLDGGVEAKCFASGMAAVCAVFETVSAGEHVVAPHVMYHGSQDWLRRISEKRSIGLSFFEATDLDALQRAVQPGKTSIVWIETPVNPTWDLIDIRAAADIAHQAGATLAVDATVSSPVTTRALEHDADIVFHSATKYLNGHSDVLGGILVSARQDERWEDIKRVRTLTGGVLGPFEAWLLLRGMRTLFLRFERASQNALQIARHFEHHPLLERVLYPGLESHPGHGIACRQMTNGFGGMLSLLVRGGADEARAIAANTEIIVRATSLGGVESLIEHRASIEGPHSAVPKNLLRLSIGIENCQELIDDLEQSLRRSAKT